VEHFGWGFIPLFKTAENENSTFSIYANSGLMQIPLFGGEVDKAILISALKSEDPV
jgi:hypothetical protein